MIAMVIILILIIMYHNNCYCPASLRCPSHSLRTPRGERLMNYLFVFPKTGPFTCFLL